MVVQKLKKISKYKRDLQCSIHLQPLLQFSYRLLYYKKSKVSVSEHYGCLQVKGGGCLNSRLCSILFLLGYSKITSIYLFRDYIEKMEPIPALYNLLQFTEFTRI
ncbi:Hypothetical_protein [Hexamita inflata]|uniref:Hypothetical_protein n=1 Tax=Hexamita inflata TaxID=28002 RepID=A0AA86QYD7_9EUKA|nr:Hypothetical protein HINF_LOCUS53187 [Hexamita inflata]